MAAANGQPPPDLKTLLLSEGHRFSFFQAIRLLKRLADGNLRVRPELSFGFPSADVARIEEQPDQKGYRITSTFLGLYGVSSPLPAFYTEELFREDSAAMRDFIDIVHERLYALLIEAWQKYRLFFQIEEARQTAPLDMLLALCGISEAGAPAARRDFSVGLIRYAGMLGGHPRSALGLAALLTDFLGGCPVNIVSYVPRSVRFTHEQRLRLGSSQNVLGETSFIGEELVDCQSKFRVRIGPVNRERFRALLQGGQDHQAMVDRIERYLSDPLDYDFELILSTEEIRPACLGGSEWSRLGLDVTLFTGEFPGDLRVIFPPARTDERCAA